MSLETNGLRTPPHAKTYSMKTVTKLINAPQVYSEPSEISKMEFFAKITTSF